jgi:arabinose-5-phosphate isomerase
VVIGLSKGGETTEVVFLAEIARLRGARVIAITEAPASSLGQAADVVLRATVPDDVDPFGMVATGSSLFFAALCDAVCVVLLEERGYSRDAFAETHPGGAVGQRIREGRG